MPVALMAGTRRRDFTVADRIDDNEVRRIAHLARLSLTDEEVHRFGSQLSGILDYMRTLDELDTDGVEPTAHPLPIRDVFRADEPTASLGTARVLENAPATDAPFFKVPKVLDQESA